MLKFNFIDEILAKHSEGYTEREREALLKESKELDYSFFRKEITKAEYDSGHEKLHSKLVIIDLELLFEKTTQRINKVLENQNKSSLNEKRGEEFLQLSEEKNRNEKEVKEGAGLFEENKLDAESFKQILKDKHSQAMELEEEIKELFRQQAKDDYEAKKIILSTAKELENGRAEEIIADLSEQLNKNPERKVEPIDFPQKEKVEITHHRRRRERSFV